jgi:hypothetical protein
MEEEIADSVVVVVVAEVVEEEIVVLVVDDLSVVETLVVDAITIKEESLEDLGLDHAKKILPLMKVLQRTSKLFS